MQQPEIVNKPSMLVVGFEAPFIHALSPDKTNHLVIGPLWDKIVDRCGEVANRSGEFMVGVIYGRPEAERSHRDELQYIAAVPVTALEEIPAGMNSREISATTFAVFTHRGPIAGIGDTVAAIYRDWLPQSSYEHSGVADIEIYGECFAPDSDESEMEYWISVAPRG